MPIKAKDITNFLGITSSVGNVPIPPSRNPNSVADISTDRRVLYEWETITRNPSLTGKSSVTKQSRSIIVIGAVVGLLLILMQEFLLIAVVASLIFLKYVLASTQGTPIKHRILNRGIEYGGEFYAWEELKQFFFIYEGGDILCVDTLERFPGRLFFNIKPGTREKMQEILETYIAFVPEAPKMFGDNLLKVVTERVNFSSTEVTSSTNHSTK